MCCVCIECPEVFELQALEGARQKNDSIKDEIWHELAQVQYLCWQQESAAALDRQERLQIRMQQMLQHQHSHELATQVLSCLSACLAHMQGVPITADDDGIHNTVSCLPTHASLFSKSG